MSSSLEFDRRATLLWRVSGEDRTVPLQCSTEKFLDFWEVRSPGKIEEEGEEEESEITFLADDMKEEDKQFQFLQRKKDTVTYILRALQHIRDFHRDQPKAERERLSFNQRRLKAIEYQRQRLQKQLSGEHEENAELLEESYLLVAKILNSLSVITPILLGIFFHERRTDSDLKIQDTAIMPHAKKPTCWMLGEKVFDVCKTSTRTMLLGHLSRAFEVIGVQADAKEKDLEFWMGKIRSVMEVVSSGGKSVLHGVSEEASAFRILLQNQRDEKKGILMSLDEKYGLIGENDEAKHKTYLEAIQNLNKRISDRVKTAYPDAELSIYGSCLSDLSIGKSSDVDLSIHIEETKQLKDKFEEGEMSSSKYEKDMKDTLYKVCRTLQSQRKDFRSIAPVARARVPVIRGTLRNANNPYSVDGSMDFDICFLNSIAVVNSSLLREYTLVDRRVRDLIVAVKKWAKTKDVGSAKDNSLSSYTWTCMVVFYLQNLGLVPNLQDPFLMEKAGVKNDPKNFWNSVDNLDTSFAKWEDVKQVWTVPAELASMTVIEMLYGFFLLYAKELDPMFIVSIKRTPNALIPKTVFRRCGVGLAIEDPFETYDSHKPHDLGSHANETKMQRIIQYFNEAEGSMKQVIQDALDGKEGEVNRLWAESTVVIQGKSNRQVKREKKTKSREAATVDKDEETPKPDVDTKEGEEQVLSEKSQEQPVNGQKTNSGNKKSNSNRRGRKGAQKTQLEKEQVQPGSKKSSVEATEAGEGKQEGTPLQVKTTDDTNKPNNVKKKSRRRPRLGKNKGSEAKAPNAPADTVPVDGENADEANPEAASGDDEALQKKSKPRQRNRQKKNPTKIASDNSGAKDDDDAENVESKQDPAKPKPKGGRKPRFNRGKKNADKNGAGDATHINGGNGEAPPPVPVVGTNTNIEDES